MAQMDATRRNAAHVEGMGGLSVLQVGVGGPPGNFLQI